MYITRDVYLPVYDDETGEERLFSTTDIDSEGDYLDESYFSDYDDYLDESYFSDYDDYDDYMQRMYAEAPKAGRLKRAGDFIKRHKWGLGLGAAGLGLAGGGAYYLNKRRKQKLAEAAAAQEIADNALEEAQYAQQMYAETPVKLKASKLGIAKDFVKRHKLGLGLGAAGLGLAGGGAYYLNKRRKQKLAEAAAAQEIADDALEEAQYAQQMYAQTINNAPAVIDKRVQAGRLKRAGDFIKRHKWGLGLGAAGLGLAGGGAYYLNKRRKQKSEDYPVEADQE